MLTLEHELIEMQVERDALNEKHKQMEADLKEAAVELRDLQVRPSERLFECAVVVVAAAAVAGVVVVVVAAAAAAAVGGVHHPYPPPQLLRLLEDLVSSPLLPLR